MSLPTPSQSVSHKRFHQCVNHKKKLSYKHFLPIMTKYSKDSGSHTPGGFIEVNNVEIGF